MNILALNTSEKLFLNKCKITEALQTRSFLVVGESRESRENL